MHSSLQLTLKLIIIIVLQNDRKINLDPWKGPRDRKNYFGRVAKYARPIGLPIAVVTKTTLLASLALPMNTVEPNPTAPCKG